SPALTTFGRRAGKIFRHHETLAVATTASTSDAPQRRQKRRVGALPSPQSGQMRSPGWMVRVGGSWGRAVGRGRCVCAGCRAAGWWATGASAAAAAGALSTGAVGGAGVSVATGGTGTATGVGAGGGGAGGGGAG